MVLLPVQTKPPILSSHFSFLLVPKGIKQGILESSPLPETIHVKGAALFGSSISSKDLTSVINFLGHFGDFDLANKEVNNIIAEGYPVSQILAQLFEVVVETDDASDERKACMCKSLATADKCLIDGADEYLQLLDVASNTMRALCNMPQERSYDS
ncbi:replication factor C subunit 2 isoform X9 [Populus alba x Populus x berolinensis]|nr:replication factor C subunit 2 isoform X9 [Populus alba x Populus x berolinensis]